LLNAGHVPNTNWVVYDIEYNVLSDALEFR